MFSSIFRPALVTLALTTASGWAKDFTADQGEWPEGAIKQTAAEARAADVARVAYGRGVSEAEVEKALDFQAAFEKVARDLDARYPEQIARIWVASAPALEGFIEFVGQAPAVRVPEGVKVLGGGKLSRAEHARRAEVAADALRADGHRAFFTHFDVRRNAIRVEMVVKPGAATPDPRAIADRVRAAIQVERGVSAKSAALSAVELVAVQREGDIFEMEWSRGGLWCRDGGNEECTSGWAVEGPNGDGIITAGHCTGLDSIGGSDHAMTWRSEVQDRGDVEYHTTAGVEVAEFWASSAELRDVESTKETLWMLPGNDVCVYGRSSDIRDCTHEIEATNVTVVTTAGVTLRDMVRASGDSTIGGDSGGGWSFDTKAWGVHSASNGTDSFFTPIGKAQSQLNVSVLLAP